MSTHAPAHAGADRPRRGRLWRAVGLAAGLLILAWAWRTAGLHEAGSLWSNRERAVDYLLGQRADESTLDARRREALRVLRTEAQARARARLEADLAARGKPSPGLMALMRDAEAEAAREMERLAPGELERMLDARLAAEGLGRGRTGGYFPPETSPRLIFGDPSRAAGAGPPASWLAAAGARVGGGAGTALGWLAATAAGDGYVGKLLETIAIALWGTVLAVVVAVPASVLGSARTLEVILPGRGAGHRAVRWVGKFVVRRSFDVTRGFNEIVLAMIFVAVLGLGPLPGVLALLVHTYGVLGKVFADALETLDMRPVEGVQSTGASWSQVVCFAVLPQSMPTIVSQSLLRLESNVRGATVLGVVGAGGIGQLLMDKFGAYKFQEVATMMIIIIVVVTAIDSACGRVLKRLG